MVIDRINNWFNVSKQYFFTYKEGFFNLSYLSNSPDLIVKSCMKMPFMKVDEKKQMIYTDTPFCVGEFRYAELEEGLWVMNTIMTYKNNVSYKPIYDKLLKANYYCICINIVENKVNASFYEFDNYKVENHSISFLKPATDFLNCHFKGSTENMYFVYFSDEWAEKNIINSSGVSNVVKDLFSDKSIGYLNYKYNKQTFKGLIEQFELCFSNSLKLNLFDLKKVTYHFFDLFFTSIEERETLESIQLSLKEQIRVEKVAHFLIGNLCGKFPGIELLSEKYKISPTKLKQNFKLLYGMPLFQYFQSKQMELALKYINEESLMIKDISQIFGYENASKFSKTFQKYHNTLPSEINS